MVDLSSSLRRALEDWDVVKAETEVKKQESRPDTKFIQYPYFLSKTKIAL